VKPYHAEQGIEIYHGDCREILPTLSDIGLILADPPYGIDFATNFTRLPGGGQDHPRVFGDDGPFDPTHLLGISRYLILWGANNYARHLPPSNTWIVWDKRYGMDSDAFLGDAELAWTNLTGGYRSAVFRGLPVNPANRKAGGTAHKSPSASCAGVSNVLPGSLRITNSVNGADLSAIPTWDRAQLSAPLRNSTAPPSESRFKNSIARSPQTGSGKKFSPSNPYSYLYFPQDQVIVRFHQTAQKRTCKPMCEILP